MTAGVCSPWATLADVCAPCNDYDFDPAALELGFELASEVLYNLTGRIYPGECEDTVRPCANGVWCGCGGLPAVGRQAVRHYFPGAGCGCDDVDAVVLPGYPVVAIVEVLVDGQVVDADTYRVDNRRELVRIGSETWPINQNLSLPSTEPGTFEVTYLYGDGPPPGGVRAAAVACSPDKEQRARCRLPARVTSVTRQGLTAAVIDPLTLFQDGLTGVAEVDLWVASEMLGRKRRRGRVIRPDRRRGRYRRTGT
jgi:hypothetical protein